LQARTNSKWTGSKKHRQASLERDERVYARAAHYQSCDYCPGSIITRNTITDESTTHILSGLHFERDVHLTELYIDGSQLFCSLDLGIECLGWWLMADSENTNRSQLEADSASVERAIECRASYIR
jgi:hypothetical protein